MGTLAKRPCAIPELRLNCRAPGSNPFWSNVRVDVDSAEMAIPSRDSVTSNNGSRSNHTTEWSSMWTAGPAARAPHPLFEFRAHPFDMLPPCLIFLDGNGPADPLVARERCDVFPSRQCLRVGGERLSEIGRKVMYDSSGDLNGGHRVISQLDFCASRI